ncbi:Acetyl-coenzyme A synthetase [Trichinella spiralis]|uniref:Acetyl-coenzyme A synthetase n=1 Tax=Trichinella spiralis TaxID=6334 RepID=A0ABR3KAM7_TRISP
MDPMQMSESVDESEKKEDIITFQRFPNENIANIPRGGRETETTPVVKFYKSSFGSALEKQKCTQIKMDNCSRKVQPQEPAMAKSTTACAHNVRCYLKYLLLKQT